LNGGRAFSVERWIILAAALFGVALTTSLGLWQMRRAAYKEGLAAELVERAQRGLVQGSMLRALTRSSGASNEHRDERGGRDRPEWLGRQAQIDGRWRHEYTVFLENRLMQVAGSPRVGFYVLTPLQVEGGDDLIWVQRGWVQRDFQDRARLPGLPELRERVTVHGRLIEQASRAYEMSQVKAAPAGVADQGSPDPRAGRIWQNLPSAWLTSAHVLPMVLLQTQPEAAEDGLLRNWPVPDAGVAKHHAYAFQWFALSALLVILYVWFQLIAPRRRAAWLSA